MGRAKLYIKLSLSLSLPSSTVWCVRTSSGAMMKGRKREKKEYQPARPFLKDAGAG